MRERDVEHCNKSMIGCFLDLMDTRDPTICATTRSSFMIGQWDPLWRMNLLRLKYFSIEKVKKLIRNIREEKSQHVWAPYNTAQASTLQLPFLFLH